MAAALECWSGRPSTDEDMVEQVLMKTQDRSEAYPASDPQPPAPSSPDAPAVAPKKWQRLGRNFAGAITALKNSLNLDSIRDPTTRATDQKTALWGGIVRNLTQLYPGSQLPEKAISNIRRHFDSLPNSYAQAGHDMKEVLLHARLVELAAAEDRPAVHVQELAAEGSMETKGTIFRLTFASHSPISWPAMADALDGSSICCKKVQIFEKKGLAVGVATLLVPSPSNERVFKARAEAALRTAIKKSPPKNNAANVVKLPFGLCGCQEQDAAGVRDEEAEMGGAGNIYRQEFDREVVLPSPLPESSIIISIDEWQTIRSGAEELGRWLLRSDDVEIQDRAGSNSFRGHFRGRKAWIKKVRGCECAAGAAYEVELKKDLLELMSCGHRNILQLHGVCLDEHHGLCLVTRFMDGSVHDLIQRNKRISARDVVRIAADVAEGLKFMNDRGVPYRDLNAQRILLDKQGSACLGDMGVVSSCNNAGDVTEYETAGYRWLAPEIIAGDPETVTETWMSNVYSFGMVVWEMAAGEVAYSSYSPVQAAVGIAACGLRPEIPKDCPPVLKSLMIKCWHSNPAKRPPFSEIVCTLARQIR